MKIGMTAVKMNKLAYITSHKGCWIATAAVVLAVLVAIIIALAVTISKKTYIDSLSEAIQSS